MSLGGPTEFVFTAADRLPLIRHYGEEEQVVVKVEIVRPQNPTGFAGRYAECTYADADIDA